MPGFNWARNMFIPVDLSEENMETIPTPRLELHVHTTTKTIQAGVIIGGGIVGPIISLITKKPMLDTVLQSGTYGAIVGAVAGPLMNGLVTWSSSKDAIFDRSYRLRYNRNQVRTDRMTYYSAAIGGAATAYYYQGMGAGMGAVPGVIAGIGIGTLLGGLYNATIARPSKETPERTIYLKTN